MRRVFAWSWYESRPRVCSGGTIKMMLDAEWWLAGCGSENNIKAVSVNHLSQNADNACRLAESFHYHLNWISRTHAGLRSLYGQAKFSYLQDQVSKRILGPIWVQKFFHFAFHKTSFRSKLLTELIWFLDLDLLIDLFYKKNF